MLGSAPKLQRSASKGTIAATVAVSEFTPHNAGSYARHGSLLARGRATCDRMRGFIRERPELSPGHQRWSGLFIQEPPRWRDVERLHGFGHGGVLVWRLNDTMGLPW